MADLPLPQGDDLVPAQLSPCVGGLVRTWTEAGTRLWSVPDDAALAAVQGTGVLARSPRAEGRFRETALLHEESATLFLRTSSPDGVTTSVQLAPAGPARPEARETSPG